MNYMNGCTVKTTKKYPRITAGPLRHQYLHRVVAAALVGRDLLPSEQVNHKDQDRLNFHFSNLFILGEKDHGWVSAKQAWFMKQPDIKAKSEWDTFMAEQESKQVREIAVAKAEGRAWECVDGKLEEQWENRNA